MDIDNLIERLMNLTYRDKGDDYDYHIILKRNRDLVSNEIKSWADEQKTKTESEMIDNRIRLAELEAKVYTYESIIANSNFAPIISKEKGNYEPRI